MRLGRSALTIPQVVSDQPSQPTARILSGEFSQNPPYSSCFLLVISHPLTPLASVTAKPHHSNPYTNVTLLNKVCLPIL